MQDKYIAKFVRVIKMIVFNKLFETMQHKGVTQYQLYQMGFSKNQIDRIKKNMNTNSYTLNRLCKVLNCKLEDIAEYIPDEDDDK